MFNNDPSRDAAFLYELARDFETSEIVGYLRRGKNPAVRQRAAEVLGDLSDVPDYETGDEVIEALIRTVRDGDEEEDVRARAADSLYRYGQDAFERLIDSISGLDVDTAPDWVTARVLVDWLSADRPEFRMLAAAALGRLDDDSFLPPLIEALTDPDPRVRVQAARACGLRGDSRCIDPLADRLEDPEAMVREQAAIALGTIGTRRALKQLIPLARTGDETLRRIAVEELSRFRTLEPLVVLVQALEDDSPEVQRTAILSLIELLAGARDEETASVRGEVTSQLAKADTDVVAPLLIDLVAESEQRSVRHNATWMLGEVTDVDADCLGAVYDCLIDALDDDDGTTAQLAADSLAKLEGEDLERRLHIFVQDERGSDDAIDRAESVLEAIGSDFSQEVVTNAVDYTYVRDPADYTEQKRESEDEDPSDGT